jgi:hypothetical protein
MTVVAAIHILDCSDSLEVFTHAYAATAKDTLGKVPNYERIHLLNRHPTPDGVQFRVTDAVVFGLQA